VVSTQSTTRKKGGFFFFFFFFSEMNVLEELRGDTKGKHKEINV
jgi:hypothetical protein